MPSAAASAAGRSASSSVPGSSGRPHSLRQLARRVLETEVAHLRGRRPDEGEAGGFAGFGEFGVLGQEAVTRDESPPRRDCARDFEDALARADSSRRPAPGRCSTPRRPAARAASSRRLRSRRRPSDNAQRLDGSQDAARDGAAIGDQDFLEHGAVPRRVVPALKELRDGSSRRWENAFMRCPRS